MPLAARLLLGAALAVLIVAVSLVALGGLSRVVGSLGSAMSGVIGAIAATPKPTATPAPVLEPPILDSPAQPYTNQPTVTLAGTVPRAFIGLPGYQIRIEDSVEGAPAVVLREEAVPSIASFTVPEVQLTAGRNDLTARLVSADGSGDPSPVVTYILDTQPPPVTITSPANGATVNGSSVKISGRTQALSSVAARDEANGATANTTAGGDGSFSLTIALADGVNGITVTATDPAGNTGSAVVGITKGSGALAAHLTATPYKLSAATGGNLSATVTVTDPNGQPLPGAAVQFTITVPGLAPIQPAEIMTDATGTATFSTQVPPGGTSGQTGLVVALVTTTQYGQTSARAGLAVGP